MTDDKTTPTAPTEPQPDSRRYYVRDPRQRSAFTGKPDGGWLRNPPAPAVWVKSREQAQSFTAEEIAAIVKESPYFDGCDLIPADDGSR